VSSVKSDISWLKKNVKIPWIE